MSTPSLPTSITNKDLGIPEPQKDPIIEEWILFYIPRKKRSTEFKFFKRKGTKKEIIQFARQLCDKYGVRFIHVEEMWTNLEELLKNETFF